MYRYTRKWIVQSDSDSTKFYIVSECFNDEYECTCPDFVYRKRQDCKDCKHILQVKAAPDLFKEIDPHLTLKDVLENNFKAKSTKEYEEPEPPKEPAKEFWAAMEGLKSLRAGEVIKI